MVTEPLKTKLPLLLRSRISPPTVTAPLNVTAPPLPPDGTTVLMPPPTVTLASGRLAPIVPLALDVPSTVRSRSDWVLPAAPSIGPVSVIVPPWPRPPLALNPTVDPLLSPFGTWSPVTGPVPAPETTCWVSVIVPFVVPLTLTIAVPAGMPGPEIHSPLTRPAVFATPVITFEPLAVVPVVVVIALPVLAMLLARTMVPPTGTCTVSEPPAPLATAGALTLPKAVRPMSPPRAISVSWSDGAAAVAGSLLP